MRLRKHPTWAEWFQYNLFLYHEPQATFWALERGDAWRFWLSLKDLGLTEFEPTTIAHGRDPSFDLGMSASYCKLLVRPMHLIPVLRLDLEEGAYLMGDGLFDAWFLGCYTLAPPERRQRILLRYVDADGEVWI